MAKYKVVKVFTDAYSKKTYRIGEVIELSEERANEIVEKLNAFGGEFIELVKAEIQKEENVENTSILNEDQLANEEKPKKNSKKKK